MFENQGAASTGSSFLLQPPYPAHYPVTLSVVIVNYNVRHFLEQALHAVRKAMQNIHGEIWVVDNNSADDSVRMVKEKFPEVKLIVNNHNPGFAKANNQAIRQSNSTYILLLNPDTLVEEDTFEKCIAFMDQSPSIGALGVKLLDGSGRYLPESKRGFPSPWVAFCKTTGLSALFPRNKWLNYYHLGHLRPDQTNQVDVLAGCFMFLRKKALDAAGLLDEAFFMYGEDIDLSYRITQAGYINVYFPETQIIHYKGESTKKGSLNYVKVFYQAMIIFARKHFSGGKASLFVLMLQMAIWFRATVTLITNLFKKIWLPAVDAAVIFLGMIFLKGFWAEYYYKNPLYFDSTQVTFNFPLYTSIWILFVWLNGGYEQRFDLVRLVRGLAMGSVALAAIYGFLDDALRASRALLLLGAAWSVVALVVTRLVLHFLRFRNLNIGSPKVRQVAIIGSPEESERVYTLLQQAGVSLNLVGIITPEEPVSMPKMYLNTLDRLEDLVNIFQIDELVFCSKNVPPQDIMAWMTRLGPHLLYKIVPEESLSIIGSSSSNEPGELYTIDIQYNIANPRQRRIKRLFDLIVALIILPVAPILMLHKRRYGRLTQNLLPVLVGEKSWIGYTPQADNDRLPQLKPSAINLTDGIEHTPGDTVAGRLNFLYAKDWSVWRDIQLLFKNL